MTRLRNLSVHWLFVAANYSLRIAQRGPLVGQGRTGSSSQWKLSRASLVRTIHMELTLLWYTANSYFIRKISSDSITNRNTKLTWRLPVSFPLASVATWLEMTCQSAT